MSMYSKTLEYALSLVPVDGPHHALEFGTYTGSTLRQIRDKLPERFRVFGFDSFLGLPEDWEKTQCKKGCFSTKGVAPGIHNTIIIPGWFDQTIDIYLDFAADIALLHLDADLYSSTKTILWKLNDYIKAGTLIVCDEWYYNYSTEFDDHEQRAVIEWAKEFSRKYEVVPFDGDTDPQSIERIILRVIR